ncbi:MAG: hypothetical protein FE041_00115 [Thermoplasmata archaeon]|nr:MAG: hypothetical protein FE041_00115 [Thermoplasmata archaeon]
MSKRLYLIIAVLIILISVSLLYVIWKEKQEEKEIIRVKKFQPRLLKQGALLLKKEDFEQLSPWQKYVTPNDSEVRKLANRMKNVKEAYREAVRWTWVSDSTLHGVDEKWIMPHEFLADTPNYATNPVKGRIVSDCEEQAYTLVSLLRAMGIKAENVRVVVGEVNFSGQTGGHAWVEIYEDGKWHALDATSGPYWDDEEAKLYKRRGYPYNYFKRYSYPSIEIWGYFNDIYYYNPITKEGNAPPNWAYYPVYPP